METEPDNEFVDNSNLFQILLDHATALYTGGTPIEEIEEFLDDTEAITKFFEARGHTFQNELSTSAAVNYEGDDDELDDEGEDESEDEIESAPKVIPEVEKSSKLSKLITAIIYFSLVTIVALGCHIGICHLLEVNPLRYFPSLQEKRCLLPAHPILMEMTRPVADCVFCKGQDEIIIELKTVPNKSEFAEIAYSSKPVIIQGGGKTGGMPTAFDFHKLKDIFQSEPGGVDAVSEECQFLPFRSPFISLREAFDKISENSSWEEPWYIGWSNCHPGVASKLRELFPRPNFLPEDSSSSAIDWIFIGSPGLGASMHIDYVKRPSWQAQLSGIKRWILHPPPECESECPETITFTIYPGDLLFLETNTWYHETFIDSDSLSISIGSEYD